MTERVTFKEAIVKYMHIGTVFFRGHYDDNALNIFAELTAEDQKALLRGMSSIFLMLEEGTIPTLLEESIHQALRRQAPDPHDLKAKAALAKATDPSDVAPPKDGKGMIGMMITFGLFVVTMIGLLCVIFLIGTNPDPSSAYNGLIKFLSFLL